MHHIKAFSEIYMEDQQLNDWEAGKIMINSNSHHSIKVN